MSRLRDLVDNHKIALVGIAAAAMVVTLGLVWLIWLWPGRVSPATSHVDAGANADLPAQRPVLDASQSVAAAQLHDAGAKEPDAQAATGVADAAGSIRGDANRGPKRPKHDKKQSEKDRLINPFGR